MSEPPQGKPAGSSLLHRVKEAILSNVVVWIVGGLATLGAAVHAWLGRTSPEILVPSLATVLLPGLLLWRAICSRRQAGALRSEIAALQERARDLEGKLSPLYDGMVVKILNYLSRRGYGAFDSRGVGAAQARATRQHFAESHSKLTGCRLQGCYRSQWKANVQPLSGCLGRALGAACAWAVLAGRGLIHGSPPPLSPCQSPRGWQSARNPSGPQRWDR